MFEMEEQLVNYLNKCRCCLMSLNNSENTIKITQKISSLFFELTHMELKASKIYSKSVCEPCNDQLNSFSNFQKDLIRNQLKLYKLEESLNTEVHDFKTEVDNVEHNSSLTVDYPNMKVFIKLESQHNEHRTTKDLSAIGVTANRVLKKDKVNDPFSEPTKFKKLQNTTDKNDNSFFCPICDKFFTEKRKIKPHIQRIHNKEKNYKCDLCSYSSFIRYDMTSHMKRIHFPTNDADNKCLCPECGMCVNGRHKLKQHIEKKHLNIKNYACDLCSFRVYRKSGLKNHMECVHMPKELKKLYSCDQCAAVLRSQGSLKTHKNALHREKRFKCYCGRMFSQKGAMDTHIRGFHMKERNIKCPHCDSVFLNSTGLKQHVDAVHVEQPIIACKVCGALIKSEKGMKTHMKVHAVPKFQCEICFKLFLKLPRLQDHMSAHQTLEYPCPFCTRSFRLETKLNYHLKVVHQKEKTTFLCELCSSCLSRRDVYRDHVLRQHKDIEPNLLADLLKRIKSVLPEERK